MKITINMTRKELDSIVDTAANVGNEFGANIETRDIEAARKQLLKNVKTPFAGGIYTSTGTRYEIELEEQAFTMLMGMCLKASKVISPIISLAKGVYGLLKNIQPALNEIGAEYKQAYGDPYTFSVGSYWNADLGICSIITRESNKYNSRYVCTTYIAGDDKYSFRTIDEIIQADIKADKNFTLYKTGLTNRKDADKTHSYLLKSVREDWEGTFIRKADPTTDPSDNSDADKE